MPHLPEEVIDSIIQNLTSNRDRNSASLVNKLWYTVDRYSRSSIIVSNCYAVSPTRVIARFPNLRSLTLKGKPNSRLLPSDWGGSVDPWIEGMCKNCPSLEKIKLKRMIVSDRSLDMISNCFCSFKSLVLSNCSGFTITGLSSIASNCRVLEELELERSDVTDNTGQWISSFPETLRSLVSLNIACVKGAVNPSDLERLVSRCPNLTRLSLNKRVSADTIRRILLRAPRLRHLGVGFNVHQLGIQSYVQLSLSLHKCDSIESLAFFYLVPNMLLRALYPICLNLVSVDMRHAVGVQSSELVSFVKHCSNLQRLLILDAIGDKGLGVVSNTCKSLQHLKIFRSNINGARSTLTEEGLIVISTGCQKLQSLTYFCSRMTNAALITFSKNCPNITSFKLGFSTPKQPDPTTLQPLDNGFGAIVQSCKNLKKLGLSGLLTDLVFLYVGMYGEKLESLSASNAGESDAGMHYVFNGCKSLRKVEINDCPFGDNGLLANVFEHVSMRSLWMSSCETTLGGCKAIARKTDSLNVEIVNEEGDIETEEYPNDDMKVDRLYMYQSLDGPRDDAPRHVWML